MAVTTRNRGSPAKPTAAATKKAVPKQSKKAAAAAAESSDDEEEQDSEDQDNEGDEEQSEDDSEEEEEEDTFKIHTPKATTAATPKVIPAALPTFKYEDDSEDDEDDSDEAPEAESLSSAKAKIQSAQDKEKTFLSKVQAEQKAKRVEREQKLKEQKDQSKAKKTTTTPAPAPVPEESATKATGLPTMLPMDILESVAQMDDTDKESNKATANDKKRKHMRPEDFALMELEAELKAEALKRKRTEKKQKNIGPVTVKVLDKSHLAQGHAVLQTVVDFRQQHFYGSKIQRKDAILNSSQRSQGAARKFNRK
ncbi:MAG: hypothetical protein J3R72DRAFT_494560 [Linnemannia gamsii]|nr:MAG: hypothetical protein J3R72DRAFT_494560 [Linnemannia gamsii]